MQLNAFWRDFHLIALILIQAFLTAWLWSALIECNWVCPHVARIARLITLCVCNFVRLRIRSIVFLELSIVCNCFVFATTAMCSVCGRTRKQPTASSRGERREEMRADAAVYQQTRVVLQALIVNWNFVGVGVCLDETPLQFCLFGITAVSRIIPPMRLKDRGRSFRIEIRNFIVLD